MKIRILLITLTFILIAISFFAYFYLLRGTISISSNPTGADVYINGKFMGTTPYKTKAFKGKYDVKISKDGFEEYSINVALKGRKGVSVFANLEKLEDLLVVKQNKFYKVSSDGKVVRQLGESVDGETVFVSFSPDGNKIIYEITSSSYKNSIWIMDVDGSNRKNLTGDIQVSGRDFPHFFPDGKKILFTALGSKKGYLAFWTVDIDGAQRKKLIEVKSEHEEIIYTISPDGKKILFYGYDILQNLGPTSLWVFDSTTGNLTNITSLMNGQGKVTAASFSLDGNKILFAFSGNLVGKKWSGLWVVDLNGKNMKRISKHEIDQYCFSLFKFSKDGKKVFFVSGACLWSACIDGSGEEIVTASVSDFCFFPNKEKILILTPQFHFNVINENGTEEKEITVDSLDGSDIKTFLAYYCTYGFVQPFSISPTGRHVVLTKAYTKETYIVNLYTGKITKLNGYSLSCWFPE